MNLKVVSIPVQLKNPVSHSLIKMALNFFERESFEVKPSKRRDVSVRESGVLRVYVCVRVDARVGVRACESK